MNKNDEYSFDFNDYGMTFLARYLHRLRVAISEQSDEVFESAGLTVPSHCSSLLLLLEQHGRAPITRLADALGYSHQLVNQRLAILQKHRFIRRSKDPNDRRRTLVVLTKRGLEEAAKAKVALRRIDRGLQHLIDEIDVDLKRLLEAARVSLDENRIAERDDPPQRGG